jgi:hypothetical protein
MNIRHVYIGNYNSFLTSSSSKHKAFAVKCIFCKIFHKIFSKYKNEKQYKITTSSALRSRSVHKIKSAPFLFPFPSSLKKRKEKKKENKKNKNERGRGSNQIPYK